MWNQESSLICEMKNESSYFLWVKNMKWETISSVILDIIHEFSHDRINNEIYYSDLSHKLITKRRKITIIQYITSCYSLSVSSTFLSLLSVSHSIISCIIVSDCSSIYTSFISAFIFFFSLNESEFFSNFHSSSFSYYFISIIISIVSELKQFQQ